MALKDLRSKKKVEAKEALNSLWLNSNTPKLLLDQRPYLIKRNEECIKFFNDLKSKEDPYYLAHHMALQFVLKPISLKKDLKGTFPYYKRGVKGFLLESSAVNLLPSEIQIEFKDKLKNFDVALIWFPHTILTLPKEYFKYIKRR